MILQTLTSSPVTYAILSSILIGLAMIIAQRGVRTVASLPGTAIANSSAAALFWLLSPFLWDAPGVPPMALVLFIVVGLFFPAGVTMLMLEGNRRLGPSVTASVAGTTPLFAYVIAVALLGEALVVRGLIGTAVIVAGIAILTWRRAGLPSRVSSGDLAFPLGSAVLRAVAQNMVRFGLVTWPHPYSAILIAYSASVAVGWALLRLRRERIPRVRSLGWLVGSGLMNGLGTLAMYQAFRLGDVTLVAPIVATAPLVTLTMSAFVLRDEKPTLRLVAGVLLTLVGVALIVTR